jgi:hypothetical protein
MYSSRAEIATRALIARLNSRNVLSRCECQAVRVAEKKIMIRYTHLIISEIPACGFELPGIEIAMHPRKMNDDRIRSLEGACDLLREG